MNIEQTINCEGDVVIVHHEDKPALYARIESIGPDIKKDWFRVTLLLLTMSSRTVTWSPALARRYAALKPAGPAPTTTQLRLIHLSPAVRT